MIVLWLIKSLISLIDWSVHTYRRWNYGEVFLGLQSCKLLVILYFLKRKLLDAISWKFDGFYSRCEEYSEKISSHDLGLASFQKIKWEQRLWNTNRLLWELSDSSIFNFCRIRILHDTKYSEMCKFSKEMRLSSSCSFTIDVYFFFYVCACIHFSSVRYLSTPGCQ